MTTKNFPYNMKGSSRERGTIMYRFPALRDHVQFSTTPRLATMDSLGLGSSEPGPRRSADIGGAKIHNPRAGFGGAHHTPRPPRLGPPRHFTAKPRSSARRRSTQHPQTARQPATFNHRNNHTANTSRPRGAEGFAGRKGTIPSTLESASV